MLQCYQCYKYFFPDEAYEMDHCGGLYEAVCERCSSKKEKSKDEEEE